MFAFTPDPAIIEALAPMDFGEQENEDIYYKRTKKQRSRNEGKGEDGQFWGTRDIGIRVFIWGNRGIHAHQLV